MNYFLIVIILGLCGGGYYEYTEMQRVEQDKLSADQQQITDLGAKNDALQSENKKLEDDKTGLSTSVADAQTKIADLTKQVQAAQTALADVQKQVLDARKTQAPATAKPPPPSTNDLGTITTLGGNSFQNCQLLKVDADGIVVKHSEGITKILYGLLPPELQKRFGYDPHQAAALTEAQIQFQEEQRKAASGAAGQ